MFVFFIYCRLFRQFGAEVASFFPKRTAQGCASLYYYALSALRAFVARFNLYSLCRAFLLWSSLALCLHRIFRFFHYGDVAVAVVAQHLLDNIGNLLFQFIDKLRRIVV